MKLIKSTLRKESIMLKIPIIQDVRWNTDTNASDFIWKHHETIQTVQEAGPLKRTPSNHGCQWQFDSVGIYL
jgi:hypothetical protein